MFKELLARLTLRVATIALLIGCVLGGFSLLSHLHKKELATANAEKEKVFAAAAVEVGAVTGELIKEKAANLSLSAELLKKVLLLQKAGGRLTAATNTEIVISDESKAIAGPAIIGECPKTWGDQYQRFFLDIPSGLFKRSQLFHLEQAFVRSPTGEYSVASTALREFNPITKAEIPITGVRISGTYSMVEERAPGPSRWHLRGVAAVAYPYALGGGASINPYPPIAISLIGLWGPTSKDFRGVLAVGWRPAGLTLSFGPYVGLSSKGGSFVGGALAAIEVTR